MKTFRLKYLIFYSLFPVSFCAVAQPDNIAEINGATTVTIVGNVLNVSDNNAPPGAGNISQPPPPAQQQIAPKDPNIEPTLENGFHLRYQIESPGSVERMGSVNASVASAGSSSASGGVKSKRHAATLTERSFNFKKKFRNWWPERKKKYHPTLCEKFK